MKAFFTTCFALFAFVIVQAQSKVDLQINHFLGDEAFELGKTVTSEDDLDLNVSRLEYYLSKVSIVHDGGKVSEAKNIYALVNASNDSTIDLGEHEFEQIEAINFSVGVDPDNNHLDPTLWPESHPLAPKDPSMHWGWTAGYRFVAFEGKAGASLSAKYEFHALGDKNYLHYSVPVKATENEGDWTIELNADYLKGLESLDLESGLIVHGEDAEAATLLLNFWNNVFTNAEGKGNVLHTSKPIEKSSFSVYPNPTSGEIMLTQDLLKDATLLTVVNAEGKQIMQTIVGNHAANGLTIHQPGLYKLLLATKSGRHLTTTVVVQ